MLRKLVISNYAIIDNLTVEPDKQLNTVTGETGAGKSIILGALGLILGDRADTSVLNSSAVKSVVEGHFEVSSNADFLNALAVEGLDQEDSCIIRREITPAGKSRAFVNDTPVNLTTLNKLTSMLVDLHQQFGHLALEQDSFQQDTLNAICGTLADQKAFDGAYTDYKKVKQEREEKLKQVAERKREADYKQYLLQELQEAAFTEQEIEDAEVQLKQLTHAEKIARTLAAASDAFSQGEQPLVVGVRKVSQLLQGIVDLVPALPAINGRLVSTYEELKDIAAEVEDLERKVTLDPAALEQLQQRLDLGYKLFKKHSLATTQELLELKATLESDLRATLDDEESIQVLHQQEQQKLQQATELAKVLSAKRTAQIPQFTQRMNELLVLVGMPNARFDVKTEQVPLSAGGIDAITFMLDANRSGQLLPLHKAASGGEMSRIMLCLKSLTAQALHMPTLIFDEVDAGISGEAARQVGNLLRDLARYHQVVCITHQPQVAARGTTHLYVYKQDDGGGRLTTRLKHLNAQERIEAIARMIGGENPSQAAMSNARELVAG